MTNSQEITTTAQPLKADSVIIRSNFLRLFGTLREATVRTGVSRTQIWKMIQAGEISDFAAGRFYKCGIDPGELVKQE